MDKRGKGDLYAASVISPLGGRKFYQIMGKGVQTMQHRVDVGSYAEETSLLLTTGRSERKKNLADQKGGEERVGPEN